MQHHETHHQRYMLKMQSPQRTNSTDCGSELNKICPAVLVQSVRAKIQETKSKLSNHLNQIKVQKLDQLIGPQITSHSSPESLKTVPFQKIFIFPIWKNPSSAGA